ncbi:chromosome partition protein Smc [Roseovarius mucosus]|uniref:Chromosome partition protein Smc n=1 Tax=Roseovarius mucosus TaxID=215743 RepID=A0A1V0RJ52_9RHOB|nr:ATP-binding protein [Roseovarius mucosus]ARE81784.1 chromosome partition protein Smc [Roseovarius mucosus]
MTVNSKQGSIWRRWDLHLHTPETKLANHYKVEVGDVWDTYLDALEASNIQVFGLTDYFSCENYFIAVKKYRARFPEGKKVFFPNIELRLSDAIGKAGNSPDMHVLFDNNPDVCPQAKIETFLQNLKTHLTDASGVEVSCADLASKGNYDEATVSLKDIRSALMKTFGESKPYLLIFPAKNDGMKSQDTGSPRKVSIAEEIDKTAHGFFGGSDSTGYFLETERYKEGEAKKKPVFDASDAHSFDDLERLSGDVTGYEATWIKANPSFEGLKQTLFEPEARVFIGEEPPVLQRRSKEATKFIDHLRIEKVPAYGNENGLWFRKVDVPLNPELTAIIGNKGSGKSALADILGLLGDSRAEDSFSFLANSRGNIKFKQRGYAENFHATLTWADGNSVSKNLSEGVRLTEPEKVKYLPQNYFETLTNEIQEVRQFQTEIENVVFSHVEETDRLNQSSFKELEELKTQESREKVSDFKQKLRELNHRLDELKSRSKPEFKDTLQRELEKLKAEFKALEASAPAEVQKPSEESPDQQAINGKIEAFSTLLIDLEARRKELTGKLANAKERSEKLKRLFGKLSELRVYVQSEKESFAALCKELGLKADEIIMLSFDTSSLIQLNSSIKDEIATLTTDSNLQFPEEEVFGKAREYYSVPDVDAVIEALKQKILSLREQLSAPGKRYQTYLHKIAELEKQKATLLGDEEQPAPKTIRHTENQITYIEQQLASEIAALDAERKTISKNIFQAKELILSFYTELKQSVEDKLCIFKEDNFHVSLEASFVLTTNFSDRFFEFISKSARGPFQGDGEKVLRDFVSEVDWGNFESVYSFCEMVLEKVEEHDVAKQIRQNKTGKEFCDFLFSLDFIQTMYELRLGDKNLPQLSPGEKGLLLLVFYLHLDMENTPLVIDQAEDNLDNDSIFSVLAKCIRSAKKNRQVILVTHNPNLAVGADAEQIIYVQLEKHKNYKFSYESGAIEEPRTNGNVVKVLEGTKPAFVQRRLKYQI